MSQPADGTGGGADALGPMDFSSFVISLAGTVMLHLGEARPEDSDEAAENLGLAKQTIDILGMLEDKTAGNLTTDEAKLLSGMLYQVRMAYMEKTKQRG